MPPWHPRTDDDRSVSASPPNALPDDLGDLFQRLDRAWSTLDFPALAELWDDEDPEPWYIADELGDAATGWTDFRRYWQRMSARLRAAEVRSTVQRVRRLSDDLGLAHLLVDWSLRPLESDQPHTGQSRVLAVLRRRDSAWRLVAWMEAPFHRL
jgi:SnoaL-like domain